MKRLNIILTCIYLTLYSCLSGLTVQAKETVDVYDTVSRALEQVLNYKITSNHVDSVQELVDTIFTTSPESGITETYCLGLRGYKSDLVYRKYLNALTSSLGDQKGWESIIPASLQKHALMYTALSGEHPLVTYAKEHTIGVDGIMSEIYGLFLLTAEGSLDEGRQLQIVDAILSYQLPDGGFSYMGDKGDVDVTAFALQAMAPYRSLNEVAANGIEKALNFLSEAQMPAGDFSSLGVASSESTAQVLIALCALEIDINKDQRFIKDSHTVLDGLLQYQLADGSFAHALTGQGNEMASAQCFTALVALYRMEKNQSFLYHYSDPDYDTESETTKQSAHIPYQWIVTGVVVLLGGIYIAIWGRRSRARILSTFFVASILIVAVFTLRIQSADDYYGQQATGPAEKPITISISIDCSTVAGRADFIPKDGMILKTEHITVEAGSSVLNALLQVTAEKTIQMEYKDYGYVEGIGYLYERDYGNLSGWMYRVNGNFPSVGANEYVLKEGDSVEWLYTCELGKDVGDVYDE